MPTRFPGGSIACTDGTCISAEVATGTPAAAASSRWNKHRNPQLVVSASAPKRTSSCAAAMKSGSSPRAIHHDFRGTGAAYDPCRRGKGPRRAVAHVAGDARKTGFEHQDAERHAVDGVAAARDGGRSCGINLAFSMDAMRAGTGSGYFTPASNCGFGTTMRRANCARL
jgi:hypothetical protein